MTKDLATTTLESAKINWRGLDNNKITRLKLSQNLVYRKHIMLYYPHDIDGVSNIRAPELCEWLDHRGLINTDAVIMWSGGDIFEIAILEEENGTEVLFVEYNSKSGGGSQWKLCRVNGKPFQEHKAKPEHFKIRWEAGEAECVHQCLDELGIPRKINGEDLSLWGRVVQFKLSETPLTVSGISALKEQTNVD